MLKEKISIKAGNIGENGIVLQCPLTSSFALDLKTNESTATHFEKLKSDLIPGVVDMEKVVFHPAVVKKNEDGTIDLKAAEEIQIKLHFRKRMTGDSVENFTVTKGWSTNNDMGWNDTFLSPTGTNGMGEYDDPEMSDLSDLVGFLGFTNDDIKYQKNKVKQSFLRLLFYDSDNIINNNLLTYSTSFLDSNKLYSKFVMMRNNKDFINYEGGVLVNNEANNFSFTCLEPREVDEKYDKLRLSTEVVLKDKSNIDASSDGFYIYLFKSDAPTSNPKDLFLKVEFNNAGYGKTIPFTFPNDRPEEGGFVTGYTYQDDDFRKDYIKEVGFEGTAETGEKFDYDKWHNDTYLPVKCVYDDTHKKYYYYFPWVGKNGDLVNDFENRRIVLNLYEPRLNKPSADE